MMYKTLLIAILSLFLLQPRTSAQYKMSAEQYIATYRDIAIEKMQRHGIPASITLAQGLLESGNGGSRLAIEGNNHFGIKCKGSWTGAKVYHDDDAKGECFRKYPSAEMSYEDHSTFLTSSTRYAELFKLKATDYKGWAHGLKAAGYATNPQYASLLINIIERYSLNEYDNARSNSWFTYEPPKPTTQEEGLSKIPDKKGRQWGYRNGVRYVISKEDDTWAKIARNAGLTKAELFYFNDFKGRNVELQPGMAIYVNKKKRKYADRNITFHAVSDNETSHSISQKYGIKLNSLKRMNPTLKSHEPLTNQILRVR